MAVLNNGFGQFRAINERDKICRREKELNERSESRGCLAYNGRRISVEK